MIESTINKKVYTVTVRENPGVFDFDVRFWHEDDIVVAIAGTAQFTESRLTRGREFDVYGEDFAGGGTVCLHYGTGVLPDFSSMCGKSVTIARELPLVQSLSLPTHGILPSAELEDELDKVISIIQQHEEALSRCIKAPLGSTQFPLDTLMETINLSVQSCVYSATSAAASAANSAAAAAFVGNCMTEITGNTSYAEKAAASFYNVEQQYGAVIASGTATLLAVAGGGVNAVTLAGQTATVALQQESLAQQESIAGVGGTYTAAIAQAEGQMAVYLSGCTAAAAYAGTSTVEIQGMSTSVRQMKEIVDASVTQALEAGTTCIINAGSSSYYMQQSQVALQNAQVALSGCTASAASALAKAGEAAQSATNAHASEIAAGAAATAAANASITVHNESATAHSDIRQLITDHKESATAHSDIRQLITDHKESATAHDDIRQSITTLSNTKAPLESPAFTGSPTAQTPDAGDNSLRIATTAFVQTNGGAKKQGKPNWNLARDFTADYLSSQTNYRFDADGWVQVVVYAEDSTRTVCLEGGTVPIVIGRCVASYKYGCVSPVTNGQRIWVNASDLDSPTTTSGSYTASNFKVKLRFIPNN